MKAEIDQLKLQKIFDENKPMEIREERIIGRQIEYDNQDYQRFFKKVLANYKNLFLHISDTKKKHSEK